MFHPDLSSLLSIFSNQLLHNYSLSTHGKHLSGTVYPQKDKFREDTHTRPEEGLGLEQGNNGGLGIQNTIWFGGRNMGSGWANPLRLQTSHPWRKEIPRRGTQSRSTLSQIQGFYCSKFSFALILQI